MQSGFKCSGNRFDPTSADYSPLREIVWIERIQVPRSRADYSSDLLEIVLIQPALITLQIFGKSFGSSGFKSPGPSADYSSDLLEIAALITLQIFRKSF
jgi:hypothetical protein